MEKQAYSVAEAAPILGISKTTLYELIDEGLIDTYSIGAKTLISSLTLEDWDDFFYRDGGYEVCDD